MNWNMLKQVKSNFKKTGLQLLHWQNAHVLDPASDYLLDRYVKSQTIGTDSYITLTVYEKDCCCLALPYEPRTCLRSPILSEDCQIEFTISFNDAVKTKFLWLRDDADALKEVDDILTLEYDPDTECITASGQVVYDNVEEDSPYQFVLTKQGNSIHVNEVELSVECKNEYWVSLGVLSEKGIDNSVNIHSLSIQ